MIRLTQRAPAGGNYADGAACHRQNGRRPAIRFIHVQNLGSWSASAISGHITPPRSGVTTRSLPHHRDDRHHRRPDGCIHRHASQEM